MAKAPMTVSRGSDGEYTVTTAQGETVPAQRVSQMQRHLVTGETMDQALLVVRPTLAFDLTAEIAGMIPGETRTLDIHYDERLRRLRGTEWR